jgi:hypothetical protein
MVGLLKSALIKPHQAADSFPGRMTIGEGQSWKSAALCELQIAAQ